VTAKCFHLDVETIKVDSTPCPLGFFPNFAIKKSEIENLLIFNFPKINLHGNDHY
jgi:hypothetical protein